MYNQPHAIHLKVMTLKQMNKCPKTYICVFISFLFRKTYLNLAVAVPKWIEMLR